MEGKIKRLRDKDRKNVDRETMRVYGDKERRDVERERESLCEGEKDCEFE